MTIDKEEIASDLKAAFEKWYAEMLLKAPDIVPYKDILFIAYASGAIYSSDISIKKLEILFGKLT